MRTAVVLGEALLWHAGVGSTACASRHFQASVDSRASNAFNRAWWSSVTKRHRAHTALLPQRHPLEGKNPGLNHRTAKPADAITVCIERSLFFAAVSSAAMSAAVFDAGQRAHAQTTELVEEGRRLFLEETFDGNGRTCGTCHPPSNNFTLDPAFIRTLRGNDPLFVAEPSAPQLKALEVRQLLQTSALILENLDGFDQPGVLRSVPHTLALRTSIRPRDDFPLHAATGWSGDGAPGNGTLREFAIGAVIQHFPKTLNRVEGVDFRLPTEEELDALEAFQLSLGRQEEINIEPGHPDALVFTDDVVELGKELFDQAPTRAGGGDTRRCAACHANAGANDASGNNRNFATGTMFLPNAPGCLLGFVAPGDGGFGNTPVQTMARADLCGRGPEGGPNATIAFQGNLTMNTPPLIEAADTPPFFHNNAVATIEEAVAFYTTDTFNASPSGGNRAFVLDSDEVNAIAALLRALNAMENIRSSNAYAEQALEQELERAADSIRLSIAETTDAIEVLTGGPVQLYAGTDVLPLLREARKLERSALASGLPSPLIEEAIALKEEARDLMVE